MKSPTDVLHSIALKALDQCEKTAFVPMQGGMPAGGDPAAMAGGGGMPPDPSMMGGGGMPPDPSMMGGGGMPPDPSMMGGGGMPPDPSMMGAAPAPGGAPPGGDPSTADALRQLLIEVLPQVLPQALQQAGVTSGSGEGGGGEKKKTGGKEQVNALEQRIAQLENMLQIPPPPGASQSDQEGIDQMAAGGLGPGSGQPAQAPGPLSPEAGQIMSQPLPQQGMMQTAGVVTTRSDQLHDIVMALLPQ